MFHVELYKNNIPVPPILKIDVKKLSNFKN